MCRPLICSGRCSCRFAPPLDFRDTRGIMAESTRQIRLGVSARRVWHGKIPRWRWNSNPHVRTSQSSADAGRRRTGIAPSAGPVPSPSQVPASVHTRLGVGENEMDGYIDCDIDGCSNSNRTIQRYSCSVALVQASCPSAPPRLSRTTAFSHRH